MRERKFLAIVCVAIALVTSAAERYRFVRDYKLDGQAVRLGEGETSLDLAKLGVAGWKPGDEEGSRFANVEMTYESDADRILRLYYCNEWFGEFVVNGETVATELEGPSKVLTYLDVRVRKGSNTIILRTRAGTQGWHCVFALDGEKGSGEADGVVDFTQTSGKVRPSLHASGFGPTICSCPKSTIDVLKTMNLTAARTHDWALINPNERVCDYFHIFPLMHLDATKPENYHFGPTDYLLKRTREEAGMEIFYRLGTSIEHSGKKVHFNALIPEDFDKVAEIFAATVRHYNRGWANGYHWNIKYWEIWNEPEGRENMWCLPEGRNVTESPKALFIRFFVTCLKRLKSEFPDIQVGGPALCSLAWLPDLLKACRAAEVAPDFISWHVYGNSVEEILETVSQARQICDDAGFRSCQLVLNEWHYRNCGWLELSSSNPQVQERVWNGPGSHNGIDAATYTLAVLARFQASSLDQSYYYGCRHTGAWGYKDDRNHFYKTYYALTAFGEIVKDFPVLGEVKTTGSLTTLVAKSADGKRTALLVADYRGLPGDVVLDVKGLPKGSLSARILDGSHDLEPVDVRIEGGRMILPKGAQNSASYLLIWERVNHALLVHPDEFTDKWIERAHQLGLTTLAIHPVGGETAADSLTNLVALCQTAGFRSRVDRARALGLQVEYEFHAGSYLVPRNLFASRPELFRMDRRGVRTNDFNFCVSNPDALALVARRSCELARSLYRSSHRHYFWLDDCADAFCHCPACSALSPSDQQLVVLNAMLRALRSVDPEAELAYLAYQGTLSPPTRIRPDSGVFLEYAPFRREHDKPLVAQTTVKESDVDALLACFGRANARVLEYWYDNSLRSRWRKPERRFTPDSEVVRADLAWYARRGFPEVASFACYLGPEYERLWGEPDLSGFQATGDVSFRSFYGDRGRRDRTSFRCGLEDSRVCFRFDVWDETVCAAPSGLRKRDLEDFDRVEVFFSPTADLTKDVICIELDPFGRVLDYKMRMGQPFDYEWRCQTLRVKARVVDGGYVVEASVQASELAKLGVDLSNFFIGAFRADYAPDGRLIEWYSARKPDGRPAKFHQPNMLLPAGLTL